MNCVAQRAGRMATILFSLCPIVGVGCWTLGTVNADSRTFCPAYFVSGNPPRLTLFPPDSPEVTVALPADLPRPFRVIAFSPDGRAIYGQEAEPLDHQVGITKIEFKPVRQTIVPGSAGFGHIWHLSVSPSSRRLFVTGWLTGEGKGQCGDFEIDPDSATFKTLRIALSSDCSEGPISPDGKRVLGHIGNQLGLRELASGSVQVIKGASDSGSGVWSPDGRQIAVVRDGRIFLIDADTYQLKKVGGSGSGRVEWSPDAKSLLVFRSELSCLPTLYGESLAIIHLEKGEEESIKSSHCKVMGGSGFGWVDWGAVQ